MSQETWPIPDFDKKKFWWHISGLAKGFSIFKVVKLIVLLPSNL